MTTYIIKHCGELNEEVLSVLTNHAEWWGTVEIADLLHTEMFDVIDEDGNLVGFFGNSYWWCNGDKECVISYVYVKPEYRARGIFKRMIAHTLKRNYDCKLITIGAMVGNDLAYHIYDKMFKYSRYDKKNNGHWFVVKDKRKVA